MRSPQEPGINESQWHMATHTGDFFGDIIWVILTVEPTGTLALTQQLNNFHALGGSGVATSTTTTSSTSRSSFSSACTDVMTSSVNPFGFGRPHLRPSSPTDALNDRFVDIYGSSRKGNSRVKIWSRNKQKFNRFNFMLTLVGLKYRILPLILGFVEKRARNVRNKVRYRVFFIVFLRSFDLF